MAGDSGDPVPAIREQDATGEIAAIFGDLRATLGVPVVNLIWRHIATIPGGLAWSWARVRPLYASGAVASEAALLRAALPLPDMPAWPPEALRAAGIGPEQERSIRGVLDSYNRSNAMNFVGLSALLIDLDGQSREAEARPSAESTEGGLEQRLPALPKLLTLAEMDPATAALVRRLNMVGERADGRILASMYRHLSHWPPFLALSWTLLAPIEADGRLGAAIAAGMKEARNRAAGLAGGLGQAPGALGPEAHARVRAAVDEFTTHPIGKMVAICALLRRSMPKEVAR